MSSPFTFFRKNQKSMMVVLVIFAMLAFTLDQLFYSRENQFVLLGVLLGAGFFGFAGFATGRWIQYGIGGAVLGALCGLMMPGWVMSDAERESAVASSIGIFDEKKFGQLAQQRSVADQFIMRAVEASFGQGMSQYATASRFGFGYQTDREELIFGELMRHEADKLGIVVTNDMVSDYVNQATDDKLTAQAFAKIRNDLSYEGRKLTEEELFNDLRGEIKAKLAFRMLHPQLSAMPPAPEVYYNYYRRLNVTQKVNAAAVEVDAFLGQVAEPTDAEIVAAFDKAKEKIPNQDGPGSIGFRQPRKVKLAYIELDEKLLEKSLPAVTDAEIEEHYNKNKETLYRRPVAPEIPASPAATPTEGTPEPSAPVTPDAKPESATDPAAPAAETPKTDPAPAESQPADSPAKDAPAATEQPAADPAPAADPTPESPKPENECDPVTDESTATNDEKPATAQETPNAATPEPAKPAAEKSEAGQPAADAQAADPAASPAQADVPSATPAATPEQATTPAEQPMLTIPSADGAAGAVPQFPEQKFETRPLDDELKAEIREQLQQRKVREKAEATMAELLLQMKKHETARKDHRFSLIESQQDIKPERLTADMREYSKAINPAAKKLAESSECAYVETPFVSLYDLYNSEDHPIGSAVPPGGNMFEPSGPDVANTVFSAPGDDLQFYIPRRATRNSADLDRGVSHYVWWICDNSETHVPTLDEPGIREEVVLALKREKARELAKKRADELAGKTREGLAKPDDQRQGMAASLENITITDKEGAAKVSVRQSLPFSWIRRQITSQMDFQQRQPQLSLSGIEFADEPGVYTEKIGFDFMKVIFEDMANNEVGVVPNDDLSAYYVVQVVDRNPTPDQGEDDLRQKFLTEGKTSGFAGGGVVQLLREFVTADVTREWQAGVWRSYGIDPEAGVVR